MNENEYININKVAEAKGLKSNRSLRLEINKPESKYIAREVKVNGGTSYEILYSSLEPEIQRIFGRVESSEASEPVRCRSDVTPPTPRIIQDEKLREGNPKSTALVPLNYQPTTFVSESARLTSLARLDIVKALLNYRKKFTTKKEADSMFLDLYNSGMYLPKVFKFIGTISIGTLHRWVKSYERYENAECLIPQYKFNKQGEYNTILTDEMKHILLRFLLHQNKFNYGKAIKLTKEILRKQGYENLPCDLTFKRYAENFRKNNYAEWVLKREGMKAYHDKVEPYIERDISKIEVGDIFIADGHVLNFQVINPFTGKPTRATLVGFLDWKSTALVGYEIMMTENTQCIASALRNSILNLGVIPKVVYQDNGKAFKSKFFQSCDFDEDGFNGVYANLNIHSVFAKPYNARAKVIERFFREFQEEFEKMMPSYIGTSIEDKPAWMKRGEKLHLKLHENETNNHIPTVQEVIKYINCWLEFHNKKPCPNDRSKSIQEMLNSVEKQHININILNAIYVRANNEMTQNGLLKAIAEELGERSFFMMQDNYNLILKHLKSESKIIIVDEVDYLIGNKHVIEILRDIQDNTGTPIVLVGMGFVDKKISRFKHFDDRIYKKLKFEHFDENDIKEILESMTELNFTDDAITYLSTRTNQFRQLVKAVNKIEKVAETNQIKELDEQLLKGIIYERILTRLSKANAVPVKNLSECRIDGGNS